MQQSLIPSNPSHFSGEQAPSSMAWGKRSQYFVTSPLVSLWNDVWERSWEIPYWWRVTSQIWVVLLIGWSKLSANKKHYPDLDSVASSVWNFCAPFSDVISRGSQWWRREITAVFSCYKFGGEMRGGHNNPLSSPLDRSRKSRYAWQTTVETRAWDLSCREPKRVFAPPSVLTQKYAIFIGLRLSCQKYLFWCYGNHENWCTKLHEITSGSWILRLAPAPRQKPYRMRLLFTHNNGDFGAISVTAPSYAPPRIVIFRKGFCATLWHSVNRFS